MTGLWLAVSWCYRRYWYLVSGRFPQACFFFYLPGQSDIKKLKRENEQLKREISALRYEYDRLDSMLRERRSSPEHSDVSTWSFSSTILERLKTKVRDHYVPNMSQSLIVKRVHCPDCPYVSAFETCGLISDQNSLLLICLHAPRLFHNPSKIFAAQTNMFYNRLFSWNSLRFPSVAKADTFLFIYF